MPHRRLLVSLTCLLLPALAAACGGDGYRSNGTAATSANEATGSPGAATNVASSGAQTTSSKVEPKLDAPASGFAILLQDLRIGDYLTDIPGTFVLDVKEYSMAPTFDSPAEGERLMTEWGYTDGYETRLIPEGRDKSVLNGAYYVPMEVHLLKDEAGAKKMFEYMLARIKTNRLVEPAASGPVGNEYAAFRAIIGKVPDSTVDLAAYQIIFRRGNLIALVRTDGAAPFMKIEYTRAMALIIDAKALGERETVAPTPIPTPTPTRTATATPR